MKHTRTLLAGIVLATLAAPAFAQDSRAGAYDDRWYITTGAGANQQDSDRNTENAATYTLGVGKFINPRWSVDAELNYQNPKLNPNEDLNWSQYGISVDARRHWRQEGRRWNPYVLMGVGYQRAEEEFDAFPSPDSPGQDSRGYATAKLGAGVQADFQRFRGRRGLDRVLHIGDRLGGNLRHHRRIGRSLVETVAQEFLPCLLPCPADGGEGRPNGGVGGRRLALRSLASEQFALGGQQC